MSTMIADVPNDIDLLDDLPPPDAIYRRLGQLAREERMLNRLLRLALEARREQERRRRQEPA